MKPKIPPMKPEEPTVKPVKPIFSKQYHVYCGEELVKHTDQIKIAEKQVEILKFDNAEYIRLSNNKTGEQICYTKETHQKNYRVTKYTGIPKTK